MKRVQSPSADPSNKKSKTDEAPVPLSSLASLKRDLILIQHLAGYYPCTHLTDEKDIKSTMGWMRESQPLSYRLVIQMTEDQKDKELAALSKKLIASRKEVLDMISK